MFERGTDARDNGYFFYKFLKEKHPEIKLYYIIDKKSADFHKVKEDAVAFGSFKNYWVLAHAEKIVSTHCYFGAPYINKKIFDFCRLYKNFYYLQHGVMMNSIPIYYYKAIPLKLFVCGAKPEYEYIRDVFGYPETVVKYTGLARYDGLHDASAKRQILVMPTWRDYIRTRDDFIKSSYFKNWQAILKDERMMKILEEQDLKLIFYPHYEVQKYIDCFEHSSKNVTNALFAEHDVQALLKESMLLVTDYSSVFFDFAYMGKPIVYFQFDRDEFYSKHYEQGYFSFPEMGFGHVCENADGVIENVKKCIDNSFEPEEIFKERVNNFFVLKDKNNCQRIYNAIMEISE